MTQVLMELENKIEGSMLNTYLLNTHASLDQERMLHVEASPWEKGGNIFGAFPGSESRPAECLTAAATGRSNLSTLYLLLYGLAT